MKFNKAWMGYTALGLSLGLVGCGKKKSSSTTSSDVTISGTLSTSSLQTQASALAAEEGRFNPSAVSLDSLKMSCVTFSVPPAAGTGSIGSDGSFNLTLANAKDSKFDCFVLTSSDEVVATMVFEDTSEKDMSGSSKTDSSIALSGNANFGTITLDLASGKATVDKSKIASVIAAATSSDAYWDITGSWKFSSMGSDLPKGYQDICPAGSQNNNNNDNRCDGPEDGMTIYLKQIVGKKYNTSTSQTTEDKRYGLMIWQSQSAFAACGSKLGTTFAELKQNGVDFTGADITEGEFSWASTLTGSDTLTDGWKSSAATARWNIDVGCQSKNYNGELAWFCHDTTNSTYRLEFGGGCVNASTNEPIQIQNWSNVSWTGNSNATARHTGFQASESTGTYTANSQSISIKCTNEWALSNSTEFTSSTINNNLSFDYNNVNRISQGATCSSISESTDAQKLAKLKCYADYYWEHVDSASGCVPDLRTNWSATTSAEFLTDNGRQPKNMFEANFYDLDAKGVGTFHSEREDYWGVQAGANGWTNCRVRDGFTITITPTDRNGTTANNALMEFASETALLDVDNKACVAWFINNRNGQKKDIGNGVYVYVSRYRSMAKVARQ